MAYQISSQKTETSTPQALPEKRFDQLSIHQEGTKNIPGFCGHTIRGKNGDILLYLKPHKRENLIRTAIEDYLSTINTTVSLSAPLCRLPATNIESYGHSTTVSAVSGGVRSTVIHCQHYPYKRGIKRQDVILKLGLTPTYELSQATAAKSTQHEIQILQSLSHPNIAEELGFVWSQRTFSVPILVLPFYPGRLKYGRNAPPLETGLTYMSDLFSGLRYLREKNIVHRDIKPANCLITEHRLVICDFGFARRLDKDNIYLGHLAGTPDYLAPESQQPDPYYGGFHVYHDKTDTYAGTILTALTCGMILRSQHLPAFTVGITDCYGWHTPLAWLSQSPPLKDHLHEVLAEHAVALKDWLDRADAPQDDPEFRKLATQEGGQQKYLALLIGAGVRPERAKRLTPEAFAAGLQAMLGRFTGAVTGQQPPRD